ncbi:c-type cytochrome [Pseudomonas sp. BN515]|uniref:c-type cytochrome n=1 Tax=Pseudomonas sp. BN515 TaxID=2567892 RepID=UPI00245688EA|nr:c-type cytochrome [Pseudomonas sp. BN515]MDH4870999.1 c-type cytochrome [Pseudomonas sp. BN515]
MFHERLLVTGLALASSPAFAQGDTAKGQALFAAQCGFCHSVEAGKNLMGPSLHGVYGRTSAQAPRFGYSAPLKGAGLEWNDANLDKWLTSPATLLPGNLMMYPGQPNPQQRQDLIAYLKSLK